MILERRSVCGRLFLTEKEREIFMKKKFVLLMLIGMSLCAAACGGSNVNEETVQSTDESSQAEEETENITTDTEEQEDSKKNTYAVQEEPYHEILDNYYYAISEDWDIDKMEEKGVCYMCCWRENVSEMGYTCIDVDGNGVSELLIGEVESEGASVGMFYDMYTIVDNKAVQIVSSGERDRYYLCKDYQIANEGSSSAAESSNSYYFLKDGKTLELKEAVIYDGYYAGAYDDIDNEVNPWFYSTTGFEESDYNPISEEKAWEIIDSYEYMDIVFTPFE